MPIFKQKSFIFFAKKQIPQLGKKHFFRSIFTIEIFKLSGHFIYDKDIFQNLRPVLDIYTIILYAMTFHWKQHNKSPIDRHNSHKLIYIIQKNISHGYFAYKMQKATNLSDKLSNDKLRFNPTSKSVGTFMFDKFILHDQLFL